MGIRSLKQFAKHARRPRIYFVGRSQDAGHRVAAEYKALNPEGEYLFIKIVEIIITSRPVTSEKLHLIAAITYYSKFPFIFNLLPLLQQATAIRRVVVVFAGGKEGAIDSSDFQALRTSALSIRGHLSSLITLGLETVATKAPTVIFVHKFPGMIKTSILDDVKGVVGVARRSFVWVMGRWICMPIEECGEHHLFLATSTKYSPANMDGDSGFGVTLPDGFGVAKGTNGKVGSGVYSVGSEGESSGPQVEKLLAGFRNKKMVEQVWQHTEEEFKRITGKEAV